MRAIDCELPFEAGITFGPTTRVFRYERNEQRAGLDLLSDRVVPGIAAAQLTLVEPYLDARGAQGFTDALGGRGILGGVAEEYGVIGFVHSRWGLWRCRTRRRLDRQRCVGNSRLLGALRFDDLVPNGVEHAKCQGESRAKNPAEIPH